MNNMKKIIIRFLKSYIDKKYKLAFENSDRIIEELNNKLLLADAKIRELDDKFEAEKEKYRGLSHIQQQTRDMITQDNDKIQKTIELYTWNYLLNAEFRIKSK